MTPRSPRPPAKPDRADRALKTISMAEAGELKIAPDALAERRARIAASDIHAASAAEEIATRVKDPTALEGAILRKLEAQREFSIQYQVLFPDGVRADRRSARTGGPNSTEWCLSFGFALRTVQRWTELIAASTYAEKQRAIIKKCWELAELWQAANFSSASNEWYTPANYLEAVRAVLGSIDLDPASTEQANTVVRAETFFNQTDDGLTRDWFGNVFLNPPYGKNKEHKSLAAAFCNKAIHEFETGRVDAAIILVNSLHSQTWQAPLYNYPICLVKERIHFVSADGQENENPTFQNMFVYLGRDVGTFADVFSSFGYVVRKIDRRISWQPDDTTVQPPPEPDEGNELPYDGNDDFARSYDVCLEVVRKRKAAGGKGWEPKVAAAPPCAAVCAGPLRPAAVGAGLARRAAVRAGPTSSHQQLRELTERHRTGADIRWEAPAPRRVAQRRPPAVRHACPASPRRPSMRRARPMSSPPPARAPDMAASGRDGSGQRDDGGGSDDGGGGGSDPPPPSSPAHDVARGAS